MHLEVLKLRMRKHITMFKNHYPDEERSAARPLKTSPCYSRLAELEQFLAVCMVGRELIGLPQKTIN